MLEAYQYQYQYQYRRVSLFEIYFGIYRTLPVLYRTVPTEKNKRNYGNIIINHVRMYIGTYLNLFIRYQSRFTHRNSSAICRFIVKSWQELSLSTASVRTSVDRMFIAT